MSKVFSMRILFVCRSNLFSQPGGDTVQVEQTAAHLKKHGVDVQIQTKGFYKDYRKFDLLHFFNLGRPADVLPYLKRNHPPLICTAIYIDYSVVPKTLHTSRQGKWLSLISRNAQEYAKTIARGLKGNDRFPPLRFLLKGHKRSVQEVLNKCIHLIIASQTELSLLTTHFRYQGAHSKIALGTEHLKPHQHTEKQAAVLCVARFEALKNQLTLIQAQASGNWPLLLVGDAAKNQSGYLAECKAKATENVTFQSFTTGAPLRELYATYKVHALPSFYETTGLATLEALLSGAQVVCGTGGAQQELFKEIAFFCDAADPASVNNAVKRALKSEEDHSTWVRQNFSWNTAAEKLLSIYQNSTT